MSRLFVIVATVGRGELTHRTVDLLADQTRPPDGVIVVGVEPGDVAGVDRARGHVEVAFGPRGLTSQRNRGLDLVAGRADIVTFFDDDYVPAPTYLEELERLFDAEPDIVGVTGRLIADGIHNAGYTVEEALALIAADAAPGPKLHAMEALYGCNMSIRLAAAAGLRFDERLPLYGWQEDIDFTYQLGRRGRLVKSDLAAGVHMGVKGGRSSQKRLGYSQIANVVYLLRKGTIHPRHGRRLLWTTVAANLAKTPWPEPHVDRWGRLKGNLMALVDVARGRVDPLRITSL